MRPRLRTLFPKSLLPRALLIVVLPTLLVQAVSAYIFFNRHWDHILRHKLYTLSGEIHLLIDIMQDTPRDAWPRLFMQFEDNTGLEVRFYSRLTPNLNEVEGQNALASVLTYPHYMQWRDGGELVEISIPIQEGLLRIVASHKRIQSSTVYIFWGWMMGASVFFLLIAILFMRLQVRAITDLAKVADKFGKGEDIGDYKPYGASEVRQAGHAFLTMRERIVRQIRTRTDMLSGISHDLRTPLTRMKLQLAMLGKGPEIEALQQDIQQMQHMIQEYLAFAKGEQEEDVIEISLIGLLNSVQDNYHRAGKQVIVEPCENIIIYTRPQSIQRVLTNAIDNAIHYAAHCILRIEADEHFWRVHIDDNGPGISKEMREDVFRPFTRLDTARDPNTGGVGLGLTIARDIARSGGGDIVLTTSPEGGLRVTLTMPR